MAAVLANIRPEKIFEIPCFSLVTSKYQIRSDTVIRLYQVLTGSSMRRLTVRQGFKRLENSRTPLHPIHLLTSRPPPRPPYLQAHQPHRTRQRIPPTRYNQNRYYFRYHWSVAQRILSLLPRYADVARRF